VAECTEPGLLAKLDQIPCLAVHPRQVEELSGGLTNRNLLVSTATGRYVARCAQSDTDLLGIDRDHEHLNSRAAAEAGVGAPVVDYRPDLGVLVIAYIDGVTFDNADLQRPGMLHRVAEAMRALHAGPRFAGDFDMFVRQRDYLDVVRTHGMHLPPTYLDYDERFQQIRQALAAKPTATVPCNNDLLAGNILDDGTTIWLIDYEYSGNNDPCFEIGNTAAECALSDGQLAELVTAYYAQDRADKVARTRLQRIVSRYGWALWGYIQAATSPLDFDFTAWGDERFDGAAAELDGSGFAGLLEQMYADDARSAR